MSNMTKVTDPVCGMEVDPAKSKGSFEHRGSTYHFCSTHCLEKFKNDPDAFVTRAKSATTTAKVSGPSSFSADAPSYTCPMHPEIRQDRRRGGAFIHAPCGGHQSLCKGRRELDPVQCADSWMRFRSSSFLAILASFLSTKYRGRVSKGNSVAQSRIVAPPEATSRKTSRT